MLNSQKMVAEEIPSEERQKIQADLMKMLEEIREQHKARFKTVPHKAIIYCQATYSEDYADTQKCVERVSPHTDYTVIAEDGTLTDEQKTCLRHKGCIVRTFQFKDNLPMMRNEYLEEAKKIDPHGWVLVSDPDELMCEELCNELRNIVKEAEAQGYNTLGIHARDIWIDADKLDEGEKEKEAPYKESGFWKYLLFKLTPNFRYEGVGHAKNVHEKWYSPDIPVMPMHLDKRFYYEHRKTVQKIWRNATRNLFIGGSGDNLGSLNPTWVKLREITDALSIRSWPHFEECLKKGKIDKKLKDFIIQHRSDSQYPWEAEVRELFKWYFWMHPEENTGNWKSEYTPPPIGTPSEVENYVTKCYFEILGRHPDEQGKNFYVNAILNGEIRRDDLPYIFLSSDEYRQKFGPKRNSKLAFCVMGYGEVLDMIMEAVNTVKPYADEMHVQGDNFTKQDIKKLEDLGATVHIEQWKDRFSDYKNKCYSHAGTGWVLICDHDEIPTEELAKNLKTIIQASQNATKYNMVSFDVIDIRTLKGKIMSQTRNANGKALLHINVPNAYYGNPHVWLKPNYYPWKLLKVPHAYKHVKDIETELPRSVRNVFLGGGGDNTREQNTLWVELRQLTKELKLETWRDFQAYLVKGQIDPRLLDVLKRLAALPWKDTELQDPLRYYQLLHPEEKVI